MGRAAFHLSAEELLLKVTKRIGGFGVSTNLVFNHVINLIAQRDLKGARHLLVQFQYYAITYFKT